MKVVSEEDKTCIITKWKQPSPYINFPDEINGYKVIATDIKYIVTIFNK